MSAGSIPNDVVKRLRTIHEKIRQHNDYIFITSSKKRVIPHYQKVFSRRNIPRLTKEEFEPFLHYEENGHWTCLYRNKSRLFSDFGQFKKGLANLVDESLPVSDRLSGSVDIVYGMREGLATAILMIISPDKYGVWNGKSACALQGLDLWPQFEGGLPPGEKYVRINEILREMSSKLGLDLWDNDALLGVAVEQNLIKCDS